MKELKKELDRVFSIYVRKKNIDHEMNLIQCCTCKRYFPFNKIQCGHFITRGCLALRWDEKNTAPQCVSCNIFKQGEQNKFREYLTETYGSDVLDYLNSKRNNIVKMNSTIYKALINEYKDKIK